MASDSSFPKICKCNQLYQHRSRTNCNLICRSLRKMP